MSHLETTSPIRESPAVPAAGPRLVPAHPIQDHTPFESPKLQSWHLSRRAVVYVRQSTPQQVAEHRESTERQYALADRAVMLGWPRGRVLVIDEDQGHSGQSAEGRPGFQRLLAEVGLDHVGLILGLEMSRLARSCKDWHQLLELCAIFRTLLADQDGLYDPTDFNDRLLLGLKGTMSEAELHILKGRMYQGRMNKARRGELLVHAPIGYVQSPEGNFVLDPDEQAQAVVRLVFAEYSRQGTLYALLRYLARQGVRLPVRPLSGPHRGQLEWHRPCRETLQSLLHHPIYAGAYRYAHRRKDPRKALPGKPQSGRRANDADSRILIRDRFPAYISWEQYEEIQERLAQNQSRAKAQGAPRRGPSLLGGLVYCGRCGQRLMVTYSGRANRLRYQCARNMQHYGEPLCLGVTGHDLEDFVAQRVLKVLQPASLELSLRAGDDLEQERQRLEEHWRQRLERAAQQADRAGRQYHAVEPENRLVARTLERQWEDALREQEQLALDYETFQRDRPLRLTDEQRTLVRQLAQDLPALWQAAETTPQDRQQIVRMLLDRIDVNIEEDSERMEVTLHWAGGFISHHQHVRTVTSYAQLSYLDDLVKRIVALREPGKTLARKTLAQVAEQLNREEFRPPKARSTFNAAMLSRILLQQGVHRRRSEAMPGSPHLGPGEWWLRELARHLGMPHATLTHWRKSGWVHARKVENIAGGRWIVWADEPEIGRLHRLRSAPQTRSKPSRSYPAELTTPKPRPVDEPAPSLGCECSICKTRERQAS
jgi:DNA invertase Pin-like site-specific DNA recombinase